MAIFYDGTTVSLTLTDTVAAVSFTTNFTANLPLVVNNISNATAYVGFTGADGGVLSNQKITSFQFVSLPRLTIQQTNGNAYSFTWPTLVGPVARIDEKLLDVGNFGGPTTPAALC